MRKLMPLLPLLVVIGIAGNAAVAQSPAGPAPLKHYKTDFVVKEVDATGRVVNSRSYSTTLATNDQGSPDQIRSGNRMPFQTGLDEKGNTTVQYVDIGINIDCHNVHEDDQKLAMSVKAEVSNIPGDTRANSGLLPVIRQFQWNSDVIVVLGVPTVIFSSDDVGTKSKMQVEVTATLIK